MASSSSYKSCYHFQLYKKDPNVIFAYSIVHKFFVSCVANGALKKKATVCLCMVESCEKKHRRVHACLFCEYYGCFNEQHIHEHAKTTNHAFAVDTNLGYIFCFICGDYQYDDDIETLSRDYFEMAAEIRPLPQVEPWENVKDKFKEKSEDNVNKKIGDKVPEKIEDEEVAAKIKKLPIINVSNTGRPIIIRLQEKVQDNFKIVQEKDQDKVDKKNEKIVDKVENNIGDKVEEKIGDKVAEKMGDKIEETCVDKELAARIRRLPNITVSNTAMRGLINMNNTCYLNVVIQVLVHAPMFRDYFLTLRHECINHNMHLNAESSSQVPVTNVPSCFACEMSTIVQEYYSGKTGPLAPARLLFLIWCHEPDLKGLNQHDAHQCLLALVNHLHSNCLGDNSFTGDNSLKSIIDTMFTGSLKYEYMCTVCKNRSIRTSSFVDVSLSSHYDAESTENDSTNKSLYGALRRFLERTEIDGYDCKNCRPTRTLAINYVTLKKLPVILSFHLNQLIDRKVFVSFPEFLDMSTYMLSRPAHINQEDTIQNDVPHRKLCKYYLYAVVEQRGTKAGGHYLCYVRKNTTQWFCCDDANVEPIELEDVLQKKAFMLFYHRRYLTVWDKKTDK